MWNWVPNWPPALFSMREGCSFPPLPSLSEASYPIHLRTLSLFSALNAGGADLRVYVKDYE